MKTCNLLGFLVVLAAACGSVDNTDDIDAGNTGEIVSIAISPVDPSVALGLEVPFTVEGTRDDNTTIDVTDQVTWESSSPGVATIDSDGLAETLTTGTTTITATHPTGGSADSLLTVTAAEIDHLVVTPADASSILGTDQDFTATAIYTDLTEQVVTSSATWTSSDTEVATIVNGGMATSVGVGETTITAVLDDADGDTTWTVTTPPPGTHPDYPGLDCTDLAADGAVDNGIYWIDPNGGTPDDSFEAYCDMTTDGGGWTLLAWTGDSLQTPYGVPYPGLAYCSTLDCLRGSGVPQAQATALIQRATEFGKGQSEADGSLPSYILLGDYPYSGKYVYGPMTDAALLYGAASCNDYRTGVFHTLSGPDDYDGTVVYVDDNLHTDYGPFDSDADSSYWWDVGVPTAPCDDAGVSPGSMMGTGSAFQYGPYLLQGKIGASSVWVRGVPPDAPGFTPNHPGLDCTQLRNDEGYSWSGKFWIDPNGGDNGDAFVAYCDMITDGGGWTLVGWTGNSSHAPYGIPYPGLAYCSTLDCLRGSAVPQTQTTPLLERTTEFGKGQTAAGVFVASFMDLGDYPYAGKYVYGPMTDASIVYGPHACNDYLTGVFHTLTGPTDFDGATVYVDDNLHYPYSTSSYDSDTEFYAWDVGTTTAPCSSNPTMPTSLMGTWRPDPYGPYLPAATGGSSLWFRGGTAL